MGNQTQNIAILREIDVWYPYDFNNWASRIWIHIVLNALLIGSMLALSYRGPWFKSRKGEKFFFIFVELQSHECH